jgi:thioredoxin reductase (NADPH)
VRPRTKVIGIGGQTSLETITFANSVTEEVQTAPAAALFVFIGAVPRTDWVAGLVERDEHGFILTGPDLIRDGRLPRGWALDRAPYWLEASVPGVFVAGDVRHHSIKRIASAVGEGSMAVQFVHEYLATL